MVYNLYIERDHPILFSEFAQVIEQVPDLKLITGDIVGVKVVCDNECFHMPVICTPEELMGE